MLNSKYIVSVVLGVCVATVSLAQPIFTKIYSDNRYANKGYQQHLHTNVLPYLSDVPNNDDCCDTLVQKPAVKLMNLTVQPHIDAGIGKQTASGILSNAIIGGEVQYTFRHWLAAEATVGYNMYNTPIYQQNLRTDTLQIATHWGNTANIGNAYRHHVSEGYVAARASKHFVFQLGVGRNFWGDGYRSLWLSNAGNRYPFFKTTVDVWHFKYVNMIIKSRTPNFAAHVNAPEKELTTSYATLHTLSWNATKRINISLFEAVVWHNKDSIGRRGIDINYLNPIIFYRPVEFSLGSPDNVLMGVSASLLVFRNIRLYAQGVLDEFELSRLMLNKGYWGNKNGLQLGVKMFDAIGVKNLFLQAEYNQVRPFTYSHETAMRSYGHYYQPLAHTLGANFREIVGIGRYATKNWIFFGKTAFAQYGTDTSIVNKGHDIFKPYGLRGDKNDYGHYMLQGELNRVIFAEMRAAYNLPFAVWLWTEVTAGYRQQNNSKTSINNAFFTLGLRTSFDYDNKEY